MSGRRGRSGWDGFSLVRTINGRCSGLRYRKLGVSIQMSVLRRLHPPKCYAVGVPNRMPLSSLAWHFLLLRLGM